jgi:hypothetical protein
MHRKRPIAWLARFPILNSEAWFGLCAEPTERPPASKTGGCFSSPRVPLNFRLSRALSRTLDVSRRPGWCGAETIDDRKQRAESTGFQLTVTTPR